MYNSLDAVNFEKISEVDLKERSSTGSYSTIHIDPKVGINYYMLKQVDIDGKFEFFEKIYLNVETKEEVFVYPTFVQSKLNIFGISDNTKVMIHDMFGKEINVFDAAEVVDLSSLTSGMYFVRLNNQLFKITKE